MTERVKIIAEAASNHGGDLHLAKEMIRAAAAAGADYIKFQSWRARTLRDGPKDPQYQWFIKAELTDSAHYELMEECQRQGINFLTTCFSSDRVDFLAGLGIKEIKVGSPDAASYSMLGELKKRFEHLIISTGVALEEELRGTARLLEGTGFTLLHCISLYPVPVEKVNLKHMDWLRQFTPWVGYSDHCIGIEAVKLAIARGARYVEKHFSLGEKAGCRFSPWDATPRELEEMVKYAEGCRKLLGEEEVEPGKELMDARERYLGRWGDNR